MKEIWKWILIAVGFFVFGFCCALPLFLMVGQGMNSGRFPMMRPGLRILPMLGDHPMRTVLWVAGGVLVIAVVLTLLGIGIAWLVRRARKPAPAPITPAQTCPKCSQPVETGWVACPHCGEKLT